MKERFNLLYLVSMDRMIIKYSYFYCVTICYNIVRHWLKIVYTYVSISASAYAYYLHLTFNLE